MNYRFLLFFAVFFLIYGSVNFYVGLRGWQALGHRMNLSPLAYWPALFLLAVSYPVGRFSSNALPKTVSDGLTLIGSYWMGILYYLFFLILFIDLVRVVDHWFQIIPQSVKTRPHIVAIIAILTVACIMSYGIWNAKHPVVRRYEIIIPKTVNSLKYLHIAMISDIHIGKIINKPRLAKLIEMVNGLNPDIILLPGDIIDESVDAIAEEEMTAILRKLNAPMGTYAVLGNHEYISRKPAEAIAHLQRAGIIVLRDDVVKVADSFYVVGRDDSSGQRFKKSPRKPLSELVSSVDQNFPVILLDHQPIRLEEAAAAGIDLQLSGHTHHGQFFPNNLVTRAIFEQDWGYLRKNNLQVIVSCGFGTWGPPIRIGNTPEVVSILIHFRPPARQNAADGKATTFDNTL